MSTRILKTLFLIVMLAISLVYAKCMEITTVIRHPEDLDIIGDNGLNQGGIAHEAAYIALFDKTSLKNWIGNLLNKNICKYKNVIAIDNKLPKLSSKTIKNTLGLKRTVEMDWNTTQFLKSLQNQGSSTLVIMTNDALWGADDSGNALLKRITSASEWSKLWNIGKPKFSYVYVFTGQNADYTFSDVAVYAQQYDITTDTGTGPIVEKGKCISKIPDLPGQTVTISALKPLLENGVRQPGC
jgi:hypothetical protein